MSNNQEEDSEAMVIQRRLLFDMEDTYINLLQKLIVSWVLDNTKSKESLITENNIQQLLHHLYILRKTSELAKHRILKDAELYKNIRLQLEEQVTALKYSIQSSQVLLKNAQNRCKKTQQINNLVSQVRSYPSTKELQFRLCTLNEEFQKKKKEFEDISTLESNLKRALQDFSNQSYSMINFSN